MAGVHFSFDNFKQLLLLNIGVAERLDENRAESFTLLYCDFSSVSKDVIDMSLSQVLRNSDSITNSDGNYFFVLPYTDTYGSGIVKKMFSDFFAKDINSSSVVYPKDGETPKNLLEELQNIVSANYDNDLICLNTFTTAK
ncbi:MAG: hypothetical protein COB17_02305 [Sulfurimonas sp.]|nr:MAG: hypothetical protein COB17_02305 [Sulfurimonas sp.]